VIGAGLFRLFLIFVVFVSVFGFALPQDVQAARFTGRYLLTMCSSDAQGRELKPGGHLACQAYIAGVMDYHKMIRSVGADYSVDFCVPDGTSMGEVQANIVKYLRKHHATHDSFIATPAVALGLHLYYPCGEGKN